MIHSLRSRYLYLLKDREIASKSVIQYISLEFSGGHCSHCLTRLAADRCPAVVKGHQWTTMDRMQWTATATCQIGTGSTRGDEQHDDEEE